MLAELRIDPSDRVLDNESLDGSLGDNFSGLLDSGFETGE
jgi:hypothetical protein